MPNSSRLLWTFQSSRDDLYNQSRRLIRQGLRKKPWVDLGAIVCQMSQSFGDEKQWRQKNKAK